MPENRRIVLAARPVGMPKDSDFRLEQVPATAPSDEECLVKLEYLSVDPYMRGRISGRKSYAEAVGINQPIVGGGVGIVVESKSSRSPPGTA